MAKTTKSPIASRTRSKKYTAITKKKYNCTVTVNLVRLTKSQIKAATTSGLINTPKYDLRKRIKIENSPKKKKTKVVSIATLDNMPAPRHWAILKKENTMEIKKDLCCLAKMRSFSPWPAMVVKTNGKMTDVYFFGEATNGKVSTSEIVPFEKCSLLVPKYFKLNGYLRAVRELELMLNIPHHASLTHNI